MEIQPENISLTSEIVLEDHKFSSANVEDGTNNLLCRLCMDENNHGEVNIFEYYEDVIIADMISKCIPEIKITKNDHLSKKICYNCVENLRNYYKFHQKCIECDNLQRRQLLKRKSENKTEPPKTKPKYDQIEAELMKALGEDLQDVDNLIIEVHNDEEANLRKLQEEQHCQEYNFEIYDTGIDGFREEFCTINDHLFIFQLKKGDKRNLKCLSTTNCPALAEQDLKKINNIRLIVDHNHLPLTKPAIKKLTLLHIMRKKMQNDKSLNFRNVYEEICENDPEIRALVPLKSIITQVCSHHLAFKMPLMRSFDQFFDSIENECFQRLHFTRNNQQFYQEKLVCSDGSKAVIFANEETIQKYSCYKIMYVDASFKIDTKEDFKYQLVTILIWIDDSYYPILFALINKKTQEIYSSIFRYLHDTLAPNLRPDEIVTDYEANLYYALGEVYFNSHIGGSVFYYTQNLYKKICSLNLSKELETNSSFRNIYHMILMLPLLPVNTILDGLSNIESQAVELGLNFLLDPIFNYVRDQWIRKVTPELFCVHRLENRINENVIAPFKKLRDFLMLSKGKMPKQLLTISDVAEKLIDLEGFLQNIYNAPSKKSFARDLSSSQKKNVIKAWQFIESHPKININNFFTKVLGYIKCMENQLWIWGFYQYVGDASEELINAGNFSIINSTDIAPNYVYPMDDVVVDVIVGQNDTFLLKDSTTDKPLEFQNVYEEYVDSTDK